MNLKQLETKLESYVREIIPYNAFYRYVKVEKDKQRPAIIMRIYTDNHLYYIVASGRAKTGYLGCIASTTKYRPGENWTRGNDLPDGPFNKQTWESIKHAIIKYELKPLSNYILSQKTGNQKPLLKNINDPKWK